MTKVSGHTNLYRRETGSFYFMRRVPAALLPAFTGPDGKVQNFIKVGLRTSDPTEARRLVRRVAAEVQDRLDAAETALVKAMPAKATPITGLSENDLKSIVSRWLHQQDRAALAAMPAITLAEDRADVLSDLTDAEIAIRQEAEAGIIPSEAAEILADNNLKAQVSPEFNVFVDLVGRAIIERISRDRDRVSGQTVTTAHDPLFADVSPLSPAPAAPAITRTTFDELLERWKAERKPPERTFYGFSRAVDRLCTHVGHRDPAKVSKADCIAWKGVLLASGLHAKTAANQIAAVRALYNFAIANELLPTNPAAGIVMAGKIKTAGARLPYTDEQSRMILTAARKLTGSKRWVPFMLAYTGARLEEVCQSLASDVRQEDGIWCLDICAGPGKTLKNPGSARLVPIHPALIEEGLLEHLRSVPKSGLLFPDLGPDRFGRKGGNFTKWYGRWQRTVVINDRRFVAHSWRHRFKDLCRRAGIEKAIHDALTGHSAADIGSSYGLGYTIGTLSAALGKIPRQIE